MVHYLNTVKNSLGYRYISNSKIYKVRCNKYYDYYYYLRPETKELYLRNFISSYYGII